MIEMGKNLGFDLVAEGIGSEQQAEFLLQHGCRYGQGYLYSPPIIADEAEKLIMKQLQLK
jgi:EAL domain-containing protein (putative c-di-GMP-specific phosphodiesterase class I)